MLPNAPEQSANANPNITVAPPTATARAVPTPPGSPTRASDVTLFTTGGENPGHVVPFWSHNKTKEPGSEGAQSEKPRQKATAGPIVMSLQ